MAYAYVVLSDFNCLTEDPDFVKNELEFDKARFARRMQNAKASAKHKRLEATLASIFDAFRSKESTNNFNIS
jgi:hypothetical protein